MGVSEDIKVAGDQLVEKIRELIKEGNARRVIIKKDDRVYMKIPLTWGVGGYSMDFTIASGGRRSCCTS